MPFDLPGKPILNYDQSLTETQELKTGSTLTLTVNYTGHPRPRLTWFLGEEEFSYADTTEDSSTFTVKNLTVKDSGVYKVVAENSVGTDSAEFTVSVKGDLQFSDTAPILWLECCINPLLFTIQINQPHQRTSEPSPSMLTMSFWSGMLQRMMVVHPLQDTLSKNGTLLRQAQSQLEVLEDRRESYWSPSWWRVNLMNSRCMLRMLLARVNLESLKNLSRPDFRSVSLVHTELSGPSVYPDKELIMTFHYFLFPDPPGIPRNLKAKDVTATSCTLTWDAPENDGGSPVTGYYIEKLAGTRWIKVTRTPIKEQHYKMDDLIEGSDNEFRIIAENKAGQSKPSDSTGRFIAKNPFTTPGKPEAPVVSDITKDSATISWEPPAKDGDAPVTDYLLEVKSNTDLRWKPVDKKIKDTSYKMEGLQEGVEYEFRVTAFNKAGAGQPSTTSKTAKYGE